MRPCQTSVSLCTLRPETLFARACRQSQRGAKAQARSDEQEHVHAPVQPSVSLMGSVPFGQVRPGTRDLDIQVDYENEQHKKLCMTFRCDNALVRKDWLPELHKAIIRRFMTGIASSCESHPYSVFLHSGGEAWYKPHSLLAHTGKARRKILELLESSRAPRDNMNDPGSPVLPGFLCLPFFCSISFTVLRENCQLCSYNRVWV